MQDFRSYHSICRDIVNRWVYPLVPDAQLVAGSNYVHTKRYTYRESGVRVSRSALIGDGVVLSRGTLVGDNSVLRRTNVGRDCHVGSNCSVTDSHLFKGNDCLLFEGVCCCFLTGTLLISQQDAHIYQQQTFLFIPLIAVGVVLGSHVSIDQAILCDGVTVGAGAVIPRGCVLSHGVVIGPGAVLPEFTRVCRDLAEDEVRADCNFCLRVNVYKASQILCLVLVNYDTSEISMPISVQQHNKCFAAQYVHCDCRTRG